MPPPPAVDAPARRRHRSRQRERMLDWLRATDAHPTAAQIHEALAAEMPHLSLGTVYRNLELLVAEGQLAEVLVPGGPARYDACLDPHHHFCCERCGRIVDVHMPVPRGLAGRLAREHGLNAHRVHVSFHGLCFECEHTAGKERSGEPSD